GFALGIFALKQGQPLGEIQFQVLIVAKVGQREMREEHKNKSEPSAPAHANSTAHLDGRSLVHVTVQMGVSSIRPPEYRSRYRGRPRSSWHNPLPTAGPESGPGRRSYRRAPAAKPSSQDRVVRP